jgi:tetratricopeptide (TPR) repeat protein
MASIEPDIGDPDGPGTSPAPAGTPADQPGPKLETETAKADSEGDGKTSGAKSGLVRVADNVKAIFTIVTSTFLLLVVVLCLVVIGREFVTRSVILEPIDVAAELQRKHAVTGTTLSNRLADEIEKVQSKSAEPVSGRRLLEPSWTQPDIQVPGGQLSINSVVHFLKARFGHQDLHIGGELSEHKGMLRLSLRDLDGDEQFEPIERAATQMDDLIKDGSVEMLRIIDPHVLAAAWFSAESKTNVYPNTLHWVRYSLANKFDKTASRAYNLWGNVLANQGQIDLATEKYSLSVSQSSPFAEAYSNWGDALMVAGRYKAALEKYATAIWTDSSLASAHAGWGNAAAGLGDYTTAVERLKQAIALDPDQVWPYTNLGSVYMQTGRREAAMQQYRLATQKAATRTFTLEEQSSRKDAKIELADVYSAWSEALRSLGDNEGALEKADRAAEINPSSPDAFNQWGLALQGEGRFREAIPKFERTLRINSRFIFAYINWGWSLNNLGLFNAAIERHRRALEVGPESIDAMFGLGTALNALGRYREAEQQARSALRINPFWPDAHSLLGAVLFNKGDLESGNNHFRTALAISGRSSSVLYAWGLALFGIDRNIEAVEAFQEANKIDPNEPWTLEVWAETAAALGDYQQAKDLYDRAMKRSGFADPHVGLGEVLEALGQYDKAEQEFRTALQIAPDSPWAHVALGELLLRHHQVPEGTSHYEAAVRSDPRPVWYIRWGNSLSGDEAIKKFQEAIRIDTTSVSAYASQGNIYAGNGEYFAAGAQYKYALQLNPKSVYVHLQLADLLTAQGSFLDALAEYQAALAIQPTSPRAHDGLGLTQANMGNYRDAQTQFEMAIRLNPQFVDGWVHWGDMLIRQGDYRTAVDKYRHALGLGIPVPRAYSGLGNALVNLHAIAEAIAAYREAFKAQQPELESLDELENALRGGRYDHLDYEGSFEFDRSRDNQETDSDQSPWRYLLAGEELREKGKYSAAREQYRRAISLNENFAPGYAAWARTLLEEGKPKRAKRIYGAAIRANPYCAYCYEAMGFVQARLSDLNSAVASYRRSIELQPSQISARIRLVDVLLRQHRRDLATSAYRDALGVAPNSSELQKLLWLIP